MAKETTKAPSGLSIVRSGNNFTASWKIGDKDYGDGQYFQYIVNDTGKDKWLPTKNTDIGKKTTSKKIVSIDKKKFYPNNSQYLYEIGFRVKGNRDKYTTGSGKKKKTHNPGPSAWTENRFTVNPPKNPTLSVELDEELTNVCKFTWSAPYADDDSYIFTNVQWQTILVKNSSETDGSKLSWSKATEGSAGADSSKTITEDTSILYKNGNSYTRWFRVRARGPRGNSDWRYAKHVYALSHQANVTGTSAKETEQGGFQCIVDWSVGQSGGQNPIDKTTAQYTITIPDENLTCPSGVSWNDANISRDTAAGDAAVFGIDDQLGKDQCLFIRVNTQHDSNITYGKPQLSSIGFLKDPSGLSVTTDNATHKATIRATNNSDVEDSKLIVRYVPANGDPIDVGVIQHGSTSVTVQCPNWDDQAAIAFDVYAIVGTATKQTRADGVDSYAVEAKMRSQGTISQGGSVPVAPKNVAVNRVEGKADTVKVTWDWPWSDAGSAEIAWSDHDDAWESTDEPESYTISNLHASSWNISGLETGKTWYIRVRLVAGNLSDSEDVTYGPWSDISQGTIDLSSAPNKPVLILSDSIIPEDGSTTASWVYTTTDNTAQAYAEVAIVSETGYIPIAHALTAQHITIPAVSENYSFTTGNVYNLACRVKSASGKLSEWSDIVSLTIAEPLECEIVQTSLVYEHIEENPQELSGDPVEFTVKENQIPEVTKLQVDIEPLQDLNGYDHPWVGGAGKNLLDEYNPLVENNVVFHNGIVEAAETDTKTSFEANLQAYSGNTFVKTLAIKAGTAIPFTKDSTYDVISFGHNGAKKDFKIRYDCSNLSDGDYIFTYTMINSANPFSWKNMMIRRSSETNATYEPYENICPISGWDRIDVHQNVYKYGVRWNQVDNVCTERLWDAAGITLTNTNFAHRGVVNPNYNNPFDNIYPWNQMKNCNVDLSIYRSLQEGDDIKDAITAWYGDPDFKDDGSNGFVGAYRPEFWYTAYKDGDDIIIGVATGEIQGWTHSPEYIRGYGFGVDTGDNLLSCYNDQPIANVPMSTMHTRAKNSGFTIENIFDVSSETSLQVVEFGSMNTQNNVGNGVSSLYRQNSEQPLIAENNAKRVVLPAAFATVAIEGATLDFGASNGAVVYANRRTCLGYEAYAADSSYISVKFDRALNITTDMYVSVHGLVNGPAIGGSGYIGTNGRATAYYRGSVSHANRFRYVLGAYRQQNTGAIWWCDDPELCDNYDALNISVHKNTGLVLPRSSGYIKKLGLVKGLGLVPFATEGGGNSSNPVGDYAYVPALTAVNTVLPLGGDAGDGAFDGAFYGYWARTASTSSWFISVVPVLRKP